ncbi:MAG: hypothetical protein ACR2GQ_02620 [Gemmatimonadota bacterium]
MRVALLLATLLLAPAAPTVAPDIDHYPRRVGIDVENYRFEIALSDSADTITGRAVVTIRFTRAGIAELPLDLANRDEDGKGMAVHAVSSNGSELEYRHAGDLLTIALASPGQAGTRREVVVEYGGLPRSGLRIGSNKYGDRTFFSDNWPNRARDWLPTIDHPYDKASNEFLVTAPSHYQVISNGLRVEETDRGGGTRLTHWRQSVPIATWLYGAGTLLVDLNQVQSVGPTYELTMDLEVSFKDVSIPTTVVSVELDRRQHRFVIPVTGAPSEVVLDPGTRVLFQADFGPRDR